MISTTDSHKYRMETLFQKFLFLSKNRRVLYWTLSLCIKVINYLPKAWALSTAQATVQPTIGVLPIPRNLIISTWAGTDEEPANWASECIRPIVSVIPYEVATLHPYNSIKLIVNECFTGEYWNALKNAPDYKSLCFE